MEFIAAGLMSIAVALFFAGWGMTRSVPVSNEQTLERLKQYGTRESPSLLEEAELSESFYDRIIMPTIEYLSSIMVRYAPNNTMEQLELKLLRAGSPNDWSAADFLGVRGLSALLTSGLPFLLFLSAGLLDMQRLGMVAFFLVFGLYMPNTWLDRKIKDRQKNVQKALPDALDLMTVSVEAGLAFDSALQKVAQKWDNELSEAFERVTQEMRLGRTRREAMRDMGERIDLEDMSAFVAAVLQADSLGVSMSKVLRIQSEQMRIRRRQRAEEEANKAPLKMLFPMVFLIFPSLFVVLLGPAVLQLREGFM
jgi:tight adherence protein C